MKALILCSALIATVAGCWPKGDASALEAAALRTPYDASLIDKDIAFHEGRVARDPQGAIGWSQLAGAYLKRSKESDSLPHALLAEFAAKKSLSLRRRGNIGAARRIVQAMMEQHRFADSLLAVDDALKVLPGDPAAIRLKGDVLLELGRYHDLLELTEAHSKAFNEPGGWALMARLADAQGQQATSVSLLAQAYEKVSTNPNMPADTVAWFAIKLGTELAKTGQRDDAKRRFDEALALYPRSYKAMLGLAHLAFTGGDYRSTVDWTRRVEDIAQSMEGRALRGDALVRLGKVKEGKAWLDSVHILADQPMPRLSLAMGTRLHPSWTIDGGSGGQVLNGIEIGPSVGGHSHDRLLALFFCDHDTMPLHALEVALRDSEVRQDPWAHATLAYACLKNNMLPRANLEAERALNTGNRDPELLRIAIKVKVACGDLTEARDIWRSVDKSTLDPVALSCLDMSLKTRDASPRHGS
ncbi:MAG: hypothetical protein JSS66_08340 [Armatimonadetes bacterium]|nr:hypothetical protein [Armatimonadota bacterium]